MPPRKRQTPPVPATFAPANLPGLITPDTPPPAAEPAEKPAPKPARTRGRKTPEPPAEPTPAPAQNYVPVGIRKQRSVYLEEDLWQRGRGFVAWVQYEEIADEADTMADLVSEALDLLLTQKEAKYIEGGGTFRGPVRKLRRGAGAAGKSRLSAEVRKQWENRS